MKRYSQTLDLAVPLSYALEGFFLPDSVSLAQGELNEYLELYNRTHQLVKDVNKSRLTKYTAQNQTLNFGCRNITKSSRLKFLKNPPTITLQRCCNDYALH